MADSQSYGVHKDVISCSKAPYKCRLLPCACQPWSFQVRCSYHVHRGSFVCCGGASGGQTWFRHGIFSLLPDAVPSLCIYTCLHLWWFIFQHIRKDLSTLKVYAIDVDEADEVCFYFFAIESFTKNEWYLYLLLVPTNKSIKHSKFLVIQLDDALSAIRLPDGRIKVWIHVADPTCMIKPRGIIDRSFSPCQVSCSILCIIASVIQ